MKIVIEVLVIVQIIFKSCSGGTLTMKNYLDTRYSVNFTVTNMYNQMAKATEFSYVNYSQHLAKTAPKQEAYIWNVSFTLNNNREKTIHYLPDLLKVPLDFDADRSNISVTVFGAVTSPKAIISINDKSSPPGSLGIDQAVIAMINRFPYPVKYFEVSENCYKCSPYLIGTLNPGETIYVLTQTAFTMTYSFQAVDSMENKSLCRPFSHLFKEHSRFHFNIGNHTQNLTCELLQHTAGQNAYLPILYLAILLVGCFIGWNLGTQVYIFMRKRGLLHWRKIDRSFSKDIGDPETVQKEYGIVNQTERVQLISTSKSQEAPTEGKKKRLRSLDTVRGLSLMIMIFVNYGGGGYWFFNHSKWNGVTVADLVFPWFVWIMGVSIVLSFRGRRKDSFKSCLYQIVRRSIILMGLGLFLNNDILAIPWLVWKVGISLTIPVKYLSQTSPHFRCFKASLVVLWVGIWFCSGFELSKWRIPGVLQRFAASYFFVALTELFTMPIYKKVNLKFPKSEYFQDLINNWIQWVIILVLELIWLFVTFGMSVPGCPRGYLGPGGLSNYGKYKHCTGGAAGYIDRWLLTEAHIYHSPTCKMPYHCVPYDPEGILGTINSIVICFLGVQAGKIINHYQQHGSKLLRFLLWGILLGGIGTVLCEGQKNEGIIPLNKNLWSLSFILVMAGLGFILLTIFYFLIDVINIWNGAPFIYPGMNSILVYVGSELLEGIFPFGWSGMNGSHLEYLSSNIFSVAIWSLIAYYWYTIQFFVKI